MTRRPIHTSLFSHHERTWRENVFVYPVISRRSGGLSIGINVNPTKSCTFDCVYCCVDRAMVSSHRIIHLSQIERELDELLQLAVSGELFQQAPFDQTPEPLRRLNDVAFSGDGEPTLFVRLGEAIEMVAGVLARRGLDHVKIVLITNATQLDRIAVQKPLELLARHHGEIWAKLDAGTEPYYKLIDRSPVAYDRVLRNLRQAATAHPIVIQSMFLRYRGQAPSDQEIAAYVGRLRDIVAAGGQIRQVQVYTVARQPIDRDAEMLEDAALDRITQQVRAAGIPAEVFYGNPTNR